MWGIFENFPRTRTQCGTGEFIKKVFCITQKITPRDRLSRLKLSTQKCIFPFSEIADGTIGARSKTSRRTVQYRYRHALFSLRNACLIVVSRDGNMKQHMLTHKIRDMFGSSGGNSGDESRTQTPPQDNHSQSSNGSESQHHHTSSHQQDGGAQDFSPSGGGRGGHGGGGHRYGDGSRERSKSAGYEDGPSKPLLEMGDGAPVDENGSSSMASIASDRGSSPTPLMAGSAAAVAAAAAAAAAASASNNNYNEYGMGKEVVDLKNWCQKLKEMPENIAAS
uniref:Uncharacterized protein n=1 Tax=Anopheles maculatus TaxID=74869 RepID=A0A182SX82_9DIPT